MILKILPPAYPGGGTPPPGRPRPIGRFGASRYVQVRDSWAPQVSGMRVSSASLLTCADRMRLDPPRRGGGRPQGEQPRRHTNLPYPLRVTTSYPDGMAQPVLRIDSARVAADSARRLQTPSEVLQFEAMAAESRPVRAFLETGEWVAIRTRIMGDGTTSIGRPITLDDVVRLLLWTADGYFSEEALTEAARAAYIHSAEEVRAFARAQARISPVASAPVSAATAPIQVLDATAIAA
jgi:hypothetical protein